MAVFRRVIVPILLMTLCPIAVSLFCYTAMKQNGSFALLIDNFQDLSLLNDMKRTIINALLGSQTSWTIIGIFVVIEAIFMLYLPGKKFTGPKTAKGFTPNYKDNGLLAFLLTLVLYSVCSFKLKIFSPAIIYDHFLEIITSLSVASIFVCSLLYLKGRLWPSQRDQNISNNPLFDYYAGIELYPMIGKFNIKQFTNCRFGMMSWGLIIISFAAKQHELYGLSNSMFLAVALQMIYLTKFYAWEKGYLHTLDIMHDRAGFYIVWGCLVWVPAIYTSSTLYLVHHPFMLAKPSFAIIGFVGVIAILLNYFSDLQKINFRKKNGDMKIFGKPAKYTIAHYTNDLGEKSTNLLLASGLWGISRHFHYVPEIVGALMWSIPVQTNHFFPYFYTLFLSILLLDRAHRDDLRCQNKYGPYWAEHKKKVPYHIIPYVY